MTISVKVRNTDSRDTAIVKVQTVDPVTKEPNAGTVLELKGGEETGDHDFYVHDGQSIVISEVQNG